MDEAGWKAGSDGIKEKMVTVIEGVILLFCK